MGTSSAYSRTPATQDPGWVASLPVVGAQVADFWNALREAEIGSIGQRAVPYAVMAVQRVAAQAGSLAILVVHILLTVLIAAVMFAQGEKGAHSILVLARRIGRDRGEEAVLLAASAIRGVAPAVVGTALVQTTLAGAGMTIAGVPFVGAADRHGAHPVHRSARSGENAFPPSAFETRPGVFAI